MSLNGNLLAGWDVWVVYYFLIKNKSIYPLLNKFVWPFCTPPLDREVDTPLKLKKMIIVKIIFITISIDNFIKGDGLPAKLIK